MQFIQADEFDDFRSFPPEQQFNTLFDKYKDAAYLGINFYRFADILTKNSDPLRGLVLERFANIEIPLNSGYYGDCSWRIIEHITRTFTSKGFFTDDDLELLVKLYQEKVNHYLKVYGRIDNTVEGLEKNISDLTTGDSSSVDKRSI